MYSDAYLTLHFKYIRMVLGEWMVFHIIFFFFFFQNSMMDRLNAIINDLIISNEFDLIQPVIKAGLLTLVRDQYLTEFLNTIEHVAHQQKSNFHLAFVHFNQQLIEIEQYLQNLSQNLENQYQYKFFPYQTYLSQLPYNAVRQQLLHTTHIIKPDFYLKFIDIFEYYLGAYAAQQARIACAELTKGNFVVAFTMIVRLF